MSDLEQFNLHKLQHLESNLKPKDWNKLQKLIKSIEVHAESMYDFDRIYTDYLNIKNFSFAKKF